MGRHLSKKDRICTHFSLQQTNKQHTSPCKEIINVLMKNKIKIKMYVIETKHRLRKISHGGKAALKIKTKNPVRKKQKCRRKNKISRKKYSPGAYY